MVQDVVGFIGVDIHPALPGYEFSTVSGVTASRAMAA